MPRWSITIRAGALLALLIAGCEAADPAAPETIPPAYAVTHSPAAPPFYARVERPFTIHTDDWAAVVFYRPTECVPGGFNLFDFFDIPGAFFCGPLTVAGREMRKDPDPFAAPFQSLLKGLGAVPVWLVSWADMQVAMADDVVTKTELEGLPSLLRGTADAFEEMLQPFPTRIPSRLVIKRKERSRMAAASCCTTPPTTISAATTCGASGSTSGDARPARTAVQYGGRSGGLQESAQPSPPRFSIDHSAWREGLLRLRRRCVRDAPPPFVTSYPWASAWSCR